MKNEKLAAALMAAYRFLVTAAETVISAIVFIVLYAFYLPIGIVKAVFDFSAMSAFYISVFRAADRMRYNRKRKGGSR